MCEVCTSLAENKLAVYKGCGAECGDMVAVQYIYRAFGTEWLAVIINEQRSATVPRTEK